MNRGGNISVGILMGHKLFFTIFASFSLSPSHCFFYSLSHTQQTNLLSHALSCSLSVSNHLGCNQLAHFSAHFSLLSLFSKLQTARQVEIGQPCRFRPVSDAQCAGWRVAGHGDSWRRQGRSRLHSCHPPSGCGRHKWWRSCHSQCRSPSSCHLVERERG